MKWRGRIWEIRTSRLLLVDLTRRMIALITQDELKAEGVTQTYIRGGKERWGGDRHICSKKKKKKRGRCQRRRRGRGFNNHIAPKPETLYTEERYTKAEGAGKTSKWPKRE